MSRYHNEKIAILDRADRQFAWLQRGLVAVLALAIAVLLLAACAPEQGTIEKKDYDPAWSQWISGSTSCSGTGTTRTCTTTPGHMQFYPESYDLLIVNGDEKGWQSVSPAVYDKAKVGMYYDNGEVSEQ